MFAKTSMEPNVSFPGRSSGVRTNEEDMATALLVNTHSQGSSFYLWEDYDFEMEDLKPFPK